MTTFVAQKASYLVMSSFLVFLAFSFTSCFDAFNGKHSSRATRKQNFDQNLEIHRFTETVPKSCYSQKDGMVAKICHQVFLQERLGHLGLAICTKILF